MKNSPFGILRITLIFALLVSTLSVFAQVANPLAGKKILVFSSTKGFRHSSIKPGQVALFKMAKEKGFSVDTTENAANFTEKNLKQYRIVVFLNTTGNVLNETQQIAFERYIQAGGAYFGIHAATDTEYDWNWYTKLAGGQFASHPGRPNIYGSRSHAYLDGTHARNVRSHG
jgi:cytochrome c